MSNPLAFLPARVAEQFQTTRYLYVTGLTIFVWDWCITIADEHKMLRKSRLSMPIVVYFMSRVGVLGYGISVNIFQFAATGHCQVLIYIVGGFLVVGNCSTVLLFLLQVRAVYDGSKIITGFFGILWAALLGLTIMVPLSLEAFFIGPTKQCYSTAVQPSASVAIIFNGIYDTLVFFAISFRISSITVIGDTWRMRFKSFFTARGPLSRNLLHGGQLYYLVSALATGGTCVLIFVPNVPPFYRSLLAVPSITLPSMMACRVFRETRLSSIREVHPTSIFGTAPALSEIRFASGRDLPLNNHTLDVSEDLQVRTIKATVVEEHLRHDDGGASAKQAPLGGPSFENACDRV